MKILVTGGAGYIGSHTCIELLNAGSGTGEPTADILVRHGSLHGTVIEPPK